MVLVFVHMGKILLNHTIITYWQWS